MVYEPDRQSRYFRASYERLSGSNASSVSDLSAAIPRGDTAVNSERAAWTAFATSLRFGLVMQPAALSVRYSTATDSNESLDTSGKDGIRLRASPSSSAAD